MITIQILEDNDVITKDCYSRPLSIVMDNPYSECIPTAGRGGGPINRLTWTPVQRSHPAWIGKTVKELKDFNCNTSQSNTIFCKGKLTKFMVTPLTETEFEATVYKDYLANLYIPWVKKFSLRGLSALQIKEKDPDYFKWLCSQYNVIKSLGYMYTTYINNY